MNGDIIKLLQGSKIGVLPTDTLYGIHGLALSPQVVERTYDIRDRSRSKPFIVLIADIKNLKLFDIKINSQTIAFLQKNWPNKLSVVLPCSNPKFYYLHRGTNSLAFRMPNKPALLRLIRQTGPLISTSVNPEGQEPAYTIAEAKKYFGDKLDFYVDAGRLESPPSTLIKIDPTGKIEVLRQGEVEIDAL